MKSKLKVLIISVLLPVISQAQNIQDIIYSSKYGYIYKAFREISKEDFVRKCKKNDYIVQEDEISVSTFLDLMSNISFVNTYGFAYSHQFTYQLENLSGLVDEVNIKRKDYCPRFSWNICSEKCYDFTQLFLDKFEIILTYKRELKEYDKKIPEQQKRFREIYRQIDQDATIEKNKILRKLQEDSVLNKLSTDKKKSISKTNSDFDRKIEQVELEKKREIKELQITNYAVNKRILIEKYKPKILALKKKKSKEILSVKLYWDDKINSRKKELEKIVKNKISNLEKSKIEMHITKRQEIKKHNNLNEKRKEIETNYLKAISEINEKIKKLIKK